MAQERARCWRTLAAVMLAAGVFAAVAPLLAACSASIQRSAPMLDGPATRAPDGWIGYCHRNPTAERCVAAVPR